MLKLLEILSVKIANLVITIQWVDLILKLQTISINVFEYSIY